MDTLAEGQAVTGLPAAGGDSKPRDSTCPSKGDSSYSAAHMAAWREYRPSAARGSNFAEKPEI